MQVSKMESHIEGGTLSWSCLRIGYWGRYLGVRDKR